MRSSLFPRVPLLSAKKCPARPTASGSAIHLASKPSDANSGSSSFPTARTPARLRVPLLMLTAFSSRLICSASWDRT